jgi:hypothetical protein
MTQEIKIYDKKTTQPQEVVIDYLKAKNIQIGICKYSSEIITKVDSESTWKKTNNIVTNQYAYFNHWNVNIQFNKPVVGGNPGEVKTIIRMGVKVQDNTGFSVTKSTWNDLLELIASGNIIDTSQLLYNDIEEKYKDVDLKLEETNKFIDLFTSKCVGSTKLNKEKIRVLLNNYVRRSLGEKTDYVAVFKSDEGSGKSELVCNELLGLFSKNNLVNPNAKLSEDDWKFKQYFANNTCMFIEEMGIGEKAHSAFKNFTSMTDFEIKPKGSNVSLPMLSRSTMMFALNDSEFIYGNDKTNRRFLVFDLDNNKLWVDKDNKFVSIFKDVDFEKLWAEQYKSYVNDDRYIVDWNDLAVENKKYLVKTSFKNKDNYVLSIVSNDILDNEGISVWVSSTDIQAIIKDNYSDSVEFTKNDSNEVTRLLEKVMVEAKNKTSSLHIPSVLLDNDKFYVNKRSKRFLVNLNKEICGLYKNVIGANNESPNTDFLKAVDIALEKQKQ